MGEMSAEFCGYEWPKDCERFEHDEKATISKQDSHQQTTCIRKPLPDTSHCAWHANPDKTEYKKVEFLQETRVPADIRSKSNFAESLNGAVLRDLDISGKIEFKNIKIKYSNFHQADLQGVDFSGSDMSNTVIKKYNLRFSNLSDTKIINAEVVDSVLDFSNISNSTAINTDFSQSEFLEADISKAYLSGTNFSNSSMALANLSESNLQRSNLSNVIFRKSDLTDSDLKGANISETTFIGADLSGACFSNTEFSDKNLQGVTMDGIDLKNSNISDLIDSKDTEVNNIAEPSRPPLPFISFFNLDKQKSDSIAKKWHQTARAYHDLKTEFHDNGSIGKARQLHISERRARRRETAAEVGWFSRQHLPQFVSGLFTGYGVGVWRLVGTMTALFAISTVTYALVGVADPLTYSTITFATSPPKPTGSLPIWARLVANIETFVGTLLIVSLGFVLGNREQF
jgi:uncharacterized protein YjbI with pentapeptide repeats